MIHALKIATFQKSSNFIYIPPILFSVDITYIILFKNKKGIILFTLPIPSFFSTYQYITQTFFMSTSKHMDRLIIYNDASWFIGVFN